MEWALAVVKRVFRPARIRSKARSMSPSREDVDTGTPRTLVTSAPSRAPVALPLSPGANQGPDRSESVSDMVLASEPPP